MSSNVGLSTPRGSGTSGYVQRNYAFMKPRNAGYGAPYPPVSGANANDSNRGFKQRQPDKQILEHDRRRAVEVKVMEERERLEEENERIEEEGKGKGEGKVLSEEEIEERCEALRARLLKEMEEEENRRGDAGDGERDEGRERRGWRRGPRDREREVPPRERRQFKTYQVHELAEAKIEESERFKKALGIREDTETGQISSGRKDYEPRKRDKERY
ncbi:pre-mRNA-splicing factor cwc21 [Aspergillus lentulus]|uniref:U2-type spliceosomal complex subunit CWC21 n=1 Tax=Aspergillus lentulus TaxID=293939 RepID=UPI001395548D|nr:pre-mRNA-splicing factor cwc21 [Aspergillus lentulus]GFF35789.1 pre-mRNA-splicing factor cwc21 [Aspergillus lentulus]GFF59831.1 pre-mRNA-splicing factor cwc21 [Aspergillus lentulus]GFF73552.1 pre-mRNA-splicing factor cwc21 [Aspergillus lentulus]GFG09306.1 pre-mRNA-splicing factor cwc21 [Aspergillus lentulus]